VSDLAAVLIVSAAPLVGMLLIGIPWVVWSKRRKAQQPQAHILPMLAWVEKLSKEQ
jgi:hypothetical protein